MGELIQGHFPVSPDVLKESIVEHICLRQPHHPSGLSWAQVTFYVEQAMDRAVDPSDVKHFLEELVEEGKLTKLSSLAPSQSFDTVTEEKLSSRVAVTRYFVKE